MVTIRISEYTTCFSSNEGGKIIYDLLHKVLKHGDNVVLSFKEVPSISTSFINSALIELIEDIPFETIKEKLKIVDSNAHFNKLIKDRFSFEVSAKKAS